MTSALFSPAILIADDDAELLTALAEMLSPHFKGSTIRSACDGEVALEMLKKESFQLLITDMKMPKLDGRSLIEGLKTLPPPHQPKHVIAISGFAQSEGLVKEIGRVSYFPKPVNSTLLVAHIRHLFMKDSQPKPSPTASLALTPADLTLMAPFVDAAIAVISVTASIEVKRERIYVRQPDEISGDVSGIITINSGKYVGSMAISFPEDCFLAIVRKMLGEDFKSITGKLQDAAAEICNQIYGGAKRELSARGIKFPLAIPSVVTGKSHAIKHFVEGPCIAVKFSSDCGNFLLEAVIREKKLPGEGL